MKHIVNKFPQHEAISDIRRFGCPTKLLSVVQLVSNLGAVEWE
jgi:hypothetical protein